MPSSYAPDMDRLVEDLAQANDQLAKENKRLNEIVDAFVALAGTPKQHYEFKITGAEDPNAMRAIRDAVRQSARRDS
jgi:hypothetical protein